MRSQNSGSGRHSEPRSRSAQKRLACLLGIAAAVVIVLGVISSLTGDGEHSFIPGSSPSSAAGGEDGTETARVVRVIDGDTVVLADQERVRLLGMDAPERGECHFDTASERMADLVEGKSVTIISDGQDADRYQRLLRYIEVDGVDAGLTLIEEGLAVARYDSRDGYAFHSREPEYIAADEAAVTQTCETLSRAEQPDGAEIVLEGSVL